MNNFNVVPSQGKFGESISVINQNFQIAQQEMQILENIASPSRKYATVVATSQTESETDVLPPIGSTDTIYRVGNWDGAQFDETSYTEYAWDGTLYVPLSTNTQIGEVFDISEYKAVGGTLATFANLSAALNDGNNVPVGVRRGGMSVKYVQTSDNKYIQARCRAQNFTTDVTQWQGVDDEPVPGSNNYVESGGVEKYLAKSKRTGPDSAIVSVGQMFPDGTTNENSSYRRAAPIELKAGEFILLNNGEPVYHAANASLLYETDANGVFVRSIITQGSSGGSRKEVYHNSSDETVYLGISAYTSQIGYTITKLKEAISKEDLDEAMDGIHTNFATGEEVNDVPISSKLDLSGKGLLTNSVISSYMATEDSGIITPSVSAGTVNVEGVVDSTQTSYRYCNAILLKKGNTILLNGGELVYYAVNLAVIFECDAQGNFIKPLLSNKTSSGFSDKASYTNTGDADIYVGFCVRRAQINYIMSSFTKAASILVEKEINEKESFTVIDGTEEGNYEEIQDNNYVRYSDGQIKSASSSQLIKLYVFDISDVSGEIEATIGSGDDVPAAIAFFDSDEIGSASYMQEPSVQVRAGINTYRTDIPYGAKVAAVFNREATLADPVISILSSKNVKKDEITGLNQDIAKTKRIASEGYSISNFANETWYYHFAANGFIKIESNNAVASESLEDIEIAARLGFKFIEANIHSTSDGHFVCIHGTDGTFGPEVKSKDETEITTEALRDTLINTKTLAWIKQYVTYDSYYEKYQTSIPSLEEFCIVCKKWQIGVLAGVVGNEDAVKICIKYLGNNVIVYGPPVNIRDYFNGYVLTWNNSVSIDRDRLVADAQKYGAPYICALGGNTLSNFTDEELADFVEYMHSNGYLLGWAGVYSTEGQNRDFIKSGFDLSGSGHEVNIFDANSESFDIDDPSRLPTTTGTVNADGSITLVYDQNITCGYSSAISLGKCCLVIRVNGTLRVNFGSVGGRTITSDGSEDIVISDYIFHKRPSVGVTNLQENTTVTVTKFIYKVSKC